MFVKVGWLWFNVGQYFRRRIVMGFKIGLVLIVAGTALVLVSGDRLVLVSLLCGIAIGGLLVRDYYLARIEEDKLFARLDKNIRTLKDLGDRKVG